MTSKKTKSDLLTNLETQAQIVKSAEHALGVAIDQAPPEAAADYEYARDGIKSLIDTSKAAIEKMYELAADSESPRAFEVLNAMIKSTAEMNEQLLDILKKKFSIVPQTANADYVASSVTNNAIFVGTTTDLQKLIKSNIVDV